MKKVLVISRKKWRRGGGAANYDKHGDTFLLNGRGMMCCLGFDAIACGLKKADIMQQSEPTSLLRMLTLPAAYKLGRLRLRNGYMAHTRAVEKAIELNDDEFLADSEREKRLVPLLKKIGKYAEVKFVP